MTEFIRDDYAAVFGRGTRGDPKLKELSHKFRYCPLFCHQDFFHMETGILGL